MYSLLLHVIQSLLRSLLDYQLLKKNFRVSRATLYNTLHLFLELRLVVKHSLADGTKYEASYSEDNHMSCSAVMRVTARVPGFRARMRMTRLRIRLRLSALGFALSPPRNTSRNGMFNN